MQHTCKRTTRVTNLSYCKHIPHLEKTVIDHHTICQTFVTKLSERKNLKADQINLDTKNLSNNVLESMPECYIIVKFHSKVINLLSTDFAKQQRLEQPI